MPSILSTINNLATVVGTVPWASRNHNINEIKFIIIENSKKINGHSSFLSNFN